MDEQINELLTFNEIKNFKRDSLIKNLQSPRKSNEETKLIPKSANNNKILSFKEKYDEQLLLSEKRARREKYLLDLKKKNRLNLEQFLKNQIEYEQNKNFKIEFNRNKLREEEILKTSKDKIPLCKTTLKICKKINYSPIYLRTEKILNTQKENINKIKTKYENSQTNFSLKNYCRTDIKPNKKNHKRKSSYDYNIKIRFKTWLDQQDQWNRMVQKKNIDRINSLKTVENEKKNLHPHLSQGTIKIFEDKEKNMEYNLTNDTDGDFYYRNMNTGYEKLYTDMYEIDKKKTLLYQKSLPSFIPQTNPNKKNIRSKYFNEKNYITKKLNNNINTSFFFRKKLHKKSNSVDNNNVIKSNDFQMFLNDELTNSNIFTKERNEESIEHWTHALLKIKNTNEENERLYHLNIMPTCPWNENAINEIKMCGHARDIVKKFI
jgi:hypothetical protein